MFLLLVGLAEDPLASRMIVEMVLLTPLAIAVVWAIINRVSK